MTFNESDITLVVRSLDYAARKHSDQRRKGGEASPYVNHLIDVMHILWTVGGVHDVTTIVAAILHDTIEDTDATEDELKAEFGDDVCSVVIELTDDKSLPKDMRKRLQVEHAESLSPRAALIKIADKISNISDILASPPVGWSAERKRAYVFWGREVVDKVRGSNKALERYFDELCERAEREIG